MNLIIIKNFLIFIILFLIVRYSMLQSIHNFLNIQNNNQFNIYLLMIPISLFFIFNSYFFFNKTTNNLTNNTLYYLNITIIVFFLIFYTNFLFNKAVNYILTYVLISKILIYFRIFNITVISNNLNLKLLIYNVNLLSIFYFFKHLKFRIYLLPHLTFILFVYLIIFNFLNIKLSNNVIDRNVYNYYILSDNLFSNSNFFHKVNYLLNYHCNSLYLNATSNLHLSNYDSYNSQESKSNYYLLN